MFETKAAGYSRTFYLASVAVWAGGVALLFITAVWGGFYGMMDQAMRSRESRHLAQTMASEQGSAPATPMNVAPKPFEQSTAIEPQQNQKPSGWLTPTGAAAPQRLESRMEKRAEKNLPPDPVRAPSVSPVAGVASQVGRQAPQPATPAPAAAPTLPPPLPQHAGEARTVIQQPQPPLTQGEAGVLKSIRFEPGEGRFLMTLVTTASPEKTGFFFLENPRRLAVNLQGAWRNSAPRTTEFPTGPIARVTVGEHPDYVRVTLTFRDPAAPKPADPTLTKLKDGLSVSLTTR